MAAVLVLRVLGAVNVGRALRTSAAPTAMRRAVRAVRASTAPAGAGAAYTPMRELIEPSWAAVLQDVLSSPGFAELEAAVRKEREGGNVFPPPELTFRAFQLAPFEKVRVVIIGQDPYHAFGQAHGLSFSVPRGVPTPPSLRNILAELRDELAAESAAAASAGAAGGQADVPAATTGRAAAAASGSDLSAWAAQGVLLLNSILTVAEGRPLSHQSLGWEALTDAAVRALAERRRGLVFLLWGAAAKRKAALIEGVAREGSGHLVLTAAHPSPLSAHRGFFGCGHFVRANAHLAAAGQPPIRWAAVWEEGRGGGGGNGGGGSGDRQSLGSGFAPADAITEGARGAEGTAAPLPTAAPLAAATNTAPPSSPAAALPSAASVAAPPPPGAAAADAPAQPPPAKRTRARRSGADGPAPTGGAIDASSASPEAPTAKLAQAPKGAAAKAKAKAMAAACQPPPNWQQQLSALKRAHAASAEPAYSPGCADLADRSASPPAFRFQTLVALILSARTDDAATASAFRQLSDLCAQQPPPQQLPQTSQTPEQGGAARAGAGLSAAALAQLPPAQLEALLGSAGVQFPRNKARYLRDAAAACLAAHGGDTPRAFAEICKLPGVGPKAAHLFSQQAWGDVHGIVVDSHVLRVAGRLGWCAPGATAERCRKELQTFLPADKWQPLHALLAAHGQAVCTDVQPRCRECALGGGAGAAAAGAAADAGDGGAGAPPAAAPLPLCPYGAAAIPSGGSHAAQAGWPGASEEGATGGGDEPPTDNQLRVAVSLAVRLRQGLDAEVIADRRACERFILSNSL